MPISGDTRTEMTSEKKVDDRTNEITNTRGGTVTSAIIKVLSWDRTRIDNNDKNYNESGELTSATTATYEKMP